MARIKITKLPKALSGLEMKMSAGLYGKGTNGNPQFRKSSYLEAGKISQQPTEVRSTLQPVAREGANLEAEKGETAMVNIDGMPAHFKIGGKRHSQGGTPLNLPDNSFIFSDTAKMKIKDPIILAQFGMVPKKSGYTPAEIAKKYDINKFRQILADSNTTDLERKTAERMIANYNMKLAKLALIQESMKGFPQGVPQIAMPYVMATGMDPEQFNQMATQGDEEQPDADMGVSRYGGNIISKFDTKKYGGLLKAQDGKTLTKNIAEKVAAEKEALRKQKEQDYINEAAYLEESGSPSYYTPRIDLTTSGKRPKIVTSSDQTEAMQILRQMYENLKKSQGSLPATRILDFLPGVTSLEEQSEMFKDMAEDYGYDPELLQQKFEEESYQPKYYINPKTGFITTVNKKKTTTESPIVKEINKKVKNWKIPTKDEIKSLTGYEADYLNKILIRNNQKPIFNEPIETDTKVEKKPTTVLVNKPKVKVKSDYPYEKKAEFVDEQGNPIKKYGGDLKEYQNAGQTKTIIKYQHDPKRNQSRAVYSDGTKGEWENIESVVSPEDYAKLEALHKKAYEYDPKATGKDKNVAAEEFQKLYHQILPSTARNILVKEGVTKHGEKIGKPYWELETNVDAMYGRRTKQYWEALQKLKQQAAAPTQPSAPTPPPAGPTPPAATPTAPGSTKTSTKPYEFKRYPVNMMPVSQKAPWFIQDVMPFGLSIKQLLSTPRFRPERFQTDYMVPGAVYKSPDQAIYAIQSDANAARQAQAAINNPQALAAANAATQGLAAKNIIGQMADTENYNVGIANNLANIRAGILNQAAQDRTAANRLFKRETDIEGQQYYNTQDAKEAQAMNLLTSGITNAANAFNLNQLSENYKTNPWSGGKINFIADPNAIRANKNYDQGNIWKEYSDALDYTKDPELAIELLKIKNKISPQSSGLYDPSYLATYPDSGS